LSGQVAGSDQRASWANARVEAPSRQEACRARINFGAYERDFIELYPLVVRMDLLSAGQKLCNVMPALCANIMGTGNSPPRKRTLLHCAAYISMPARSPWSQ